MDEKQRSAAQLEGMRRAIRFARTYGMQPEEVTEPPLGTRTFREVKDALKLSPVTVDFSEIEEKIMARIGVDEDRRKFCWVGAVLPGVRKRHVTVAVVPLKGTDRVELYAVTRKPEEWAPDFHTSIGLPGGEEAAMLETAHLPPEIASMSYGDERIRAVKAWHARLYSACYAEIFSQYPQIYDRVMQDVCAHRGILRINYPVRWSNDFVRMIGAGTLGGVSVDGLMEMGYITVPREWLE